MSLELSEQEQLRRRSLAALRELGIEPYPAAMFDVTATAAQITQGLTPTTPPTLPTYASPAAS